MNLLTAVPAVKRRACVACTGAKAKCTPQTVNLCQRCARLGKTCTYLNLPQTRRTNKNAPRRVVALEDKVDQLVSQIAVLTKQNQQLSPENLNPSIANSDSAHDAGLDSTGIALLLEAANDPSHGHDPPTGSILASEPSIVDRGLLSEAEAEVLVEKFRSDFVPKCPFVVIAHNETAARLNNREPFLFLCIVGVTIGSAHPLRKTVAEEIMKHVTLRIVARSERNLELLRGLLIYTTWYSYPAQRNHPQLLLFIQFCVSMLYDLGIQMRPRLNSDEQRALLGTYWLSVSILSQFGRPSALKHDERLDDCLESMATSTEHLSDRWIAPFVLLQSFLVSIDASHELLRGPGGRAVVVKATRGSLQRQFESVRASVEKHLLGCPPPTENAIRTEMKYVEVRLEELSLRNGLWIDSESTGSLRTTMLLDLIQRSKELVRSVSTSPAAEIHQITIPTSARLCAVLSHIPTAVMTLLELVAGKPSSEPFCSDLQSEMQAIYDAADYANLVTELVKALETKVEGMSDAEKQTDVVGSICSKMKLLARGHLYRVKAYVDIGPLQEAPRQGTSLTTVDANVIDGAVANSQQPWSFTYEGLDDDVFHLSDEQWASVLGDFSSFNY